MKIVLTDAQTVLDNLVDVEALKEFGEVTQYGLLKYEEVAEKIADADIVVCNKTLLNSHTLRLAKNLKYIGLFATGYNNIDIDYCKDNNIAVCNAGSYSTNAVAQHTFALMFYILEKLSYYDNYVKSGAYGNQNKFSNYDKIFTELEGKTWGIVGMGNIGKKVARIAESFGCKVIFYSASGNSTCMEFERVDFDTLLAESDILSLHCPLSDKTKDLIDYEALKKMKKTAILVNVARGPVVNNSDLYKALVEEEIYGAGLDVLEKEPIHAENPLGKFMDSTRLIITPHMAWASTEARERVVAGAYQNIRNFLDGKPSNVVNP